MALDVTIQLCLSLYDTLEATEAFQMRLADVGDEAIIGVSNMAEEVNLTRVVGAHLHDGNLSIRLDAQQGERHTDVVVQVALSVDDIVFLGQYRRDEFLGGRLAIGAGDGKHNSFALSAVIGGEVLQGLQSVIHDEDALVLRQVFAVSDDEAGHALLGHLQGKVVGIEVLTFQGEEDSVFFDLAAVGGDFVSLDVVLIYCFYHECLWFRALRPFDGPQGPRAQGP